MSGGGEGQGGAGKQGCQTMHVGVSVGCTAVVDASYRPVAKMQVALLHCAEYCI